MTSKELFDLIVESPQVGRVEIERELKALTNGYDKEVINLLLQDFTSYLVDKSRCETEAYNSNIIADYEQQQKWQDEYWRCNGGVIQEIEPPKLLPPYSMIHEPSDVYNWVIEYLNAKLHQATETDKCIDTDQATDTDQDTGISLPDELDTDRARNYFARAVKIGYLIIDNGIYKANCKKVQLGYICYKIFDTPRPIAALENYFNVGRLSSEITTAGYEVKRADVIKWRTEIDKKIFEE
jgi:hypothetical protein